MKKVILYYYYGFLVLDMIMGFLLLYLGMQGSIAINPGQIVRGSLLILLIGMLVADTAKSINKVNGCVLLAVLYFVLYVIVVYLKHNPAGMWMVELNNVSKLSFMLLLIYYINKHKYYFLERLDTIMVVSFSILTLNLFLGYFTGIGISTYGQNTTATKGLIYSGNAVSILTLVFFAYFFFEIQKDVKARYLSVIAIFDIYIVGTKTIFIVPLVILAYLITQINWTAFKVAVSAAVIIPALIAGSILLAPLISQVFESHYLSMLNKTGFNISNNEGGGANTNFKKAILSYRRIAFAIVEVRHQFQDPGGLIFGYGDSGQQQFWKKRGHTFTFAAMDFIDFLFQYGIVGCLLFYSFIFYAFYRVLKSWEFTPLTVSFVFIFLYSFFGGYVLHETTANTMFALLIGLNLPQPRRKGDTVAQNNAYKPDVEQLEPTTS
ncbi:MAG TPA: O-antigen ligase family protein [Balneolaceae bacterium]|nr:O-antigen ligase family protein [Balneolaceae bacterium]